MTRRKWLLTVGCLSVACAGTLVLAACGGGGTTYNDGNVIVDHKEIEWEEECRTESGSYGVRRYTDDSYEITYLSGNRSYITLEGSKLSEMAVTGYQGDVQTFTLADLEAIKVENEAVSVNAIADGAFRDCTTLETVDLTKSNASLTFTIGNYAFSGCEALTSITIPGTGENSVYANGNSIGSYAFAETAITSFTMDDTYGSLGAGAFQNCEALASVTLPEGLTAINSNTFEGCSSLTSFTFPTAVETIGAYAFSGAPISSFELSTMPALSSIGDNAFANNSVLRTITIPATVESLGRNVFYNDASLSSLTIEQYTYNAAQPGAPVLPLNITQSIAALFGGDTGADGFYNNGAGYAIPESFTSLQVSHLATIPDGFLYGMSSLTNVQLTLDDSLLTNDNTAAIGNEAFYGCKDLVSGLTITGTYTAIGFSAFEDTSLTSFTVPDSVESIDFRAFANTELTSFTVPSSVTELGSNVFYNVPTIESLTVEQYMIDQTNAETGEPIEPEALFSRLHDLFGAPTFTSSTSGELLPVNSNDFYIAYNSIAVPVSLESVTIGGMAYVPASFMRGMSSLTAVSLTIDDSYAENWDIAPTIGNYAFSGCENLGGGLTITGSYTSIGQYAFEGTALTSFTVPDSVESIGSHAFADTSLASFTVPANVTSLENNIFYNVDTLSSLTIASMSYYDSVDETYDTLLGNLGYIFGAQSLTAWLEENPDATEEDYPFYTAYSSSYAFPKALTSLTIGGMLNVSNNFLRGMSSLETVSLTIDAERATIATYNPSVGSYAFADCTALTNLTINGDYTSIGQYAFRDTALTSFTVPESVTSIGSNIFYDVATLESLTIEQFSHYNSSTYSNAFSSLGSLFGATSLDNWLLENPDETEEDYPFYTANRYSVPKSLTDLTIGGIAYLPASFASGASSLETVSLTFDVNDDYYYYTNTDIGASAFANCTNLSELTLAGDYLTSIGDYAFQNTALTSFTLPASVTSVGTGILNGNEITTLTIASVDNYDVTFGVLALFGTTNPIGANGDGYGTYYTVSYSGTTYYVPAAFTTLTLNNATDIPSYYAYGLTSLETVNLDSDCVSIGNDAFNGCSSLETITLPDALESIGGYAFYGCAAFEVPELPESVTFVGANAFEGCILPETENGLTILGDWLLDYSGRDVLIAPAGVTKLANEVISTSVYPYVVYYLGTEEEWALIEEHLPDSLQGRPTYLTAANYVTLDGVHYLCVTPENTSTDPATPATYEAFVIDVDDDVTVAEIAASVTIGEQAFSVVGIEDYALRGASLDTVIIPASVTSADCGANLYTGSLTVYFRGTSEAWTLNSLLPTPTQYDFATEAVTYTFMDGETTVATQTAVFATLPEAPEKEGYTFLGWYTTAEDTTEVTGTEVPFPYLSSTETDRTFYARWTEEDVAVSYSHTTNSYVSWTAQTNSTTGLVTRLSGGSNSYSSSSQSVSYTFTANTDVTISFDYAVTTDSSDRSSYLRISLNGSSIATADYDDTDTMHMEITLTSGQYITFTLNAYRTYSLSATISNITYTLA